MLSNMLFDFFFQAEDGIRDHCVTGVQTCALPIYPAEAKRLLAAAGYGGGIDLQLWRAAANVELSRVAEAIQAQLEPVGVRVELVERDASSQREAARKGETDMVILAWWADYTDADNFLSPPVQ